ncbi:spermidine synthase [Guyparkeria sp.]|uniref:spermidine synthase n=1 Tax=Guyparkeria sp. TaxID=2035736 RepID=UPI003970C189
MKANVLERLNDEHGPIEVIEQGGEVALAFGNHTFQSAWRPEQPEKLCFAYYRAMTLPLAMHPNPVRIGLLGFGGGVLAKFLIEHTESSIHAIDLRPALGPIAARHFGVDLEHPRLDLRFGDVSSPAWDPPAPLDVVLIDLFDQDGMIRLSDETVARLAEAVAPGGMICLNLWRNHMPAVVEAHRQLSAHFHPDALVAHVPDRLNTVMTYRREAWNPEDLENGLRRLTRERAPLRRAQGQAWQWLQPLRGQRR